MFSTIVLALDGSEGAKNAIPVAIALAETEGGNLVLAHVTEYLAAKGGELPHPGEEEIRVAIEQEAEQLTERGIENEVQFADTVLGGPAHAIVDIADRSGGDLIVTGSRGLTTVGDLLLGSVSHRLLHIAKRPVLVVPVSVAGDSRDHPFETIVLALDGSEAAKQAIPFAVGLARESKSRVVIAHVDERMGTRGEASIDVEEEEIRAEIQTLVNDLTADGIQATIEIAEMASLGAEIAHAIADIAEKSQADLIVTGTRGHSEIAGMFVGSVTQRLLHIAEQPVLAVPGPR
jgi:nucleotide-binding universal stress UspA family protein